MSSYIAKSMKGGSLINNLEVTNQTVENVLNVATYNQPQIYNGSFSSGSLIPINFTSGSTYQYADIKLNFRPSNLINVYISAKDNFNSPVSLIEPSEMIIKPTPVNSSTANVLTSNTGLLLLFAGSESSLSSISVVNGTNRCHFKTDSVYTYAGVGASRSLTSGFFPVSSLGSVSLYTTSGSLSGSYTVIKYY
jgi:hypothetical protein